MSYSYYRLYLFNESGSILRMEEMESVSDADALELARKHGHDGPWELWNKDRLVRRHETAAHPAGPGESNGAAGASA